MVEKTPKPEQEGNSLNMLLLLAENLRKLERGEQVQTKLLSYKELAQAEKILADPNLDSTDAEQLSYLIETSRKADKQAFDRTLTDVKSLSENLNTEKFFPLSEELCQRLEDRIVDIHENIVGLEAVFQVIAESRKIHEQRKFEADRRREKREIQTNLVNRDMETVNEIMLALEGNMATHLPDRKIPNLSEAERADLLGRIQELGLQISPEQEYFLKNGKLPEAREPQNAGFLNINGRDVHRHAAFAAIAAVEARERSAEEAADLAGAQNIPTQMVTPPEQRGFLHRINNSPLGNLARKALFSLGILAAGAGAAKAETPHHSGGRDTKGSIEHVERSSDQFMNKILQEATRGFDIKDKGYADAAVKVLLGKIDSKDWNSPDEDVRKLAVKSRADHLRQLLLDHHAIEPKLPKGSVSFEDMNRIANSDLTPERSGSSSHVANSGHIDSGLEHAKPAPDSFNGQILVDRDAGIIAIPLAIGNSKNIQIQREAALHRLDMYAQSHNLTREGNGTIVQKNGETYLSVSAR